MFTVVATIKSPSSDPVEVRWYRGESHVEALSALVQCASQDPTDHRMPKSVRTVILSVRLDISDDETPGQRGACECAENAHGEPHEDPTRGYCDGPGFCPCCRVAVRADATGIYRAP